MRQTLLSQKSLVFEGTVFQAGSTGAELRGGSETRQGQGECCPRSWGSEVGRARVPASWLQLWQVLCGCAGMQSVACADPSPGAVVQVSGVGPVLPSGLIAVSGGLRVMGLGTCMRPWSRGHACRRGTGVVPS